MHNSISQSDNTCPFNFGMCISSLVGYILCCLANNFNGSHNSILMQFALIEGIPTQTTGKFHNLAGCEQHIQKIGIIPPRHKSSSSSSGCGGGGCNSPSRGLR